MIQAYSGKLLHRFENADAIIEIRENWQYRWMHFGSTDIQTAMSRLDPAAISLPYLLPLTRLITLFSHDPRQFLVMGLGGGAIPRYLDEHYPDAEITTIEIDKNVSRLAMRYFELASLTNHHIIIDDCVNYLKKNTASADVLISDIYQKKSQPEPLLSASFYQDYQKNLRENGIGIINLICDSHEEHFTINKIIRSIFQQNTLTVPIMGYKNILILVSNEITFFEKCQRLTEQGLLHDCYYDSELGLCARSVR